MKALFLAVLVLLSGMVLADEGDAEITIDIIDDPDADFGSVINNIALPFPVMPSNERRLDAINPASEGLESAAGEMFEGSYLDEITEQRLNPDRIEEIIPEIDDALESSQPKIEGAIEDILRLVPEVDRDRLILRP